MTGIIDIAMVGSLCKKGEYHDLLNQYGLVICDECHHAASDTISNVLKEVKAKYVYGVTATPKRADGLEKINYMLIGPIRYSYTAKEMAAAQGMEHYVYPRFTRTVAPRGVITDKMHPNAAYDILHGNSIRDEQIISDVKACVLQGRTPVVLSKYKDHSEKLYSRLKEYADHVFLMTGNNSKKEHKKILEQLHEISKEETLILVATGSLIGEGFDYPRLDTLFMAMPVSARNIVEQYAGRLNRDYEGKEEVIVYDYVDSHIPMFDNMYAKRLKAYKQIGYEVCTGIKGEKQTANAIFDGDNYVEVFQRDLLEADNNIIVDFLKKFVSNTDKVIIVAMITGMVSIIGVVFTSVIAKIIDYRYNVKKYLYDKRETPYEQFISIIYTIMEDTKKPINEQMTESDKFRMMSDFSKGLTLWGSNKVVKKWLRYRKAAMEDMSPENSLLLLEDIIYEIRKDVGQRKRLGKGDVLSIFINDIENIIKK